jgi:hypothetical protein
MQSMTFFLKVFLPCQWCKSYRSCCSKIISRLLLSSAGRGTGMGLDAHTSLHPPCCQALSDTHFIHSSLYVSHGFLVMPSSRTYHLLWLQGNTTPLNVLSMRPNTSIFSSLLPGLFTSPMVSGHLPLWTYCLP